jgi:hypothetical protein
VQYALLLYRRPDDYDGLSEQESQAVTAEYYAIMEDPRVIAGEGLQPVETATTVRVRDGRVLTTDGPFADTKEVFGGYYVVDADNLDQAIEIAARVPAARLGGGVEVRPVIERVGGQ